MQTRRLLELGSFAGLLEELLRPPKLRRELALVLVQPRHVGDDLLLPLGGLLLLRCQVLLQALPLPLARCHEHKS